MDEKETRPWEPYIPTYVGMYYVDYRDDLSDNTKLLQDCIDKNSLYPISEYLDDWWEYPEAPYLEEMQNQMERDGIEWDDACATPGEVKAKRWPHTKFAALLA